ncbi:amidohydrolase family protein [Actinoplanes sp. URMC 104]|uniref:amidohydrolase family protein n=1 Tax=Actinoplanes sp. URMC 104 TaxID=3423409 RepID=UPI003F1A7DD1
MTPPDSPAVDVHAHAMPMPLLRRLRDRGLAELQGAAPSVVRLDPRVSGIAAGVPLPLARSQYEVGHRLTGMDAAGTSHHAVSLPPFLFCSTADDDAFATEIVRQGNDELADHVAQAPGRLVGLGAVPLGRPGAAEEARRCLDELGMAGIAIGSQGGGRDLDDPVNEDLWALLADRNVLVFLHPSGVPDARRQRDFYLAQLVGYPMETALAVARLIFGGVLERHDLALCLAHGGGCVPALRGRVDMGWRNKEVAHTVPLPPSTYADRLYYDTATFSVTLLDRLVADVGAGHVMLGSDFPFELSDPRPREPVRALGLDDAATRAIEWDNAAKLLGIV